MLVFKKLDIVYALLQLFVLFLLKCVHVEYKQVPIIASDPGEIPVDAAAEETVATSLLDNDGAQFLIVHMKLVAFSS